MFRIPPHTLIFNPDEFNIAAFCAALLSAAAT